MYKFSDIIKRETAFSKSNDIYYILEEPFQTDCRKFLDNYYKNNPDRNTISNYNELPYIPGYKKRPEWNFRVQTLQVIKKHIENYKPKTVMEIGPWNGWLTHHISQVCDTYICADIFDDDHDGLGTFKHYHGASWIPVHCDIEKLDFFSTGFDLIIYNHCLQFFEKWERSVLQAQKLLNAGGYIFITGMNIYNYAAEKQKQVDAYKNDYLERTKTKLLFRDSKAYFDKNDKKCLIDFGFRINNYPGYYKTYLLRLLINSRPQVCYAVYRKQL